MHGVFECGLALLLLLASESSASLVACPSTVEGNVLVAHQFECSSFFLCDRSGEKPSFLLRCPSGFSFDAAGVGVGGACSPASNVDCRPQLGVGRPRGGAPPPPPPVDAPDNYRNYTMHLPHPRNCSQFYRHEGWTDPTLYECPDGLRFDPVLEVCDLPSLVDCRGRECQFVPEPVCPSNNDSVVHLPHPSDCNAYYVCDWGQAILKHCPDDLYYNPALGVCDWPRNVECNRCPHGDVEPEEVTGRSPQ